MALSKCALEGWIFGAQRAKNETPPPPQTPQNSQLTPKLKVRGVSHSGF